MTLQSIENGRDCNPRIQAEGLSLLGRRQSWLAGNTPIPGFLCLAPPIPMENSMASSLIRAVSLPYLLAPGGRVDGDFFLDLMEIRVMLLQWTAEKATDRATLEDIRTLEGLIARLSSATTVEGKQCLDYAFFETMVAITNNRVLVLLSNAIREVYLSNNALFTELYNPTYFNLDHHRVLIESMKVGDRKRAGQAMRKFGEMAFKVSSKGENTTEEKK